MNNEQLTDFAYFKVYDHSNTLTVSAYCLPITPVTFVPSIPSNLNQKQLVWNFGDNTTSTELTATHVYTNPGKYTVNLIVYDCSNQSRLASYSQDIQVYDYLENSISLSCANVNDFTCKSGEVSPAILITQSSPWYQTPPAIFYSVSGSSTTDYFNLSADKFNHLRKHHAIIDRVYLPSVRAYEYVEIDKIEISPKNVYVRLDNSVIVADDGSSASSVFVGTTGSKIVYYRDDATTPLALIKFFLDRNSIKGDQYYNNLGVTLSATITNNSPSRLSITSNGLDGEGDTYATFNISPNKFVGIDIPFIIKLKDANNFTVKSANNFNLSAVDIKLYGYTPQDVLVGYSSSDITLSAVPAPYNSAACCRGYFNYDRDSAGITSAYLQVSAVIVDNNAASYNLSGVSSSFDIRPSTYNNIYKKGEQVDMTENIKSLRFQEIYLDKTVFFDDFIGSIFGTVSSGFDTLGKKINERIQNFIANNQHVDQVEISPLLSILDEIDNAYIKYNANNYPNLVNRAISLLSINRNRLIGFPNQFDTNFDYKGNVNSTTNGINLGSRVDTLQYVVSAGTDLVGYERFSGHYCRLNSLQPLSSGNITLKTSSSYALSSVNGDWGWPLVLPDQYTPQDINKYYNFYVYRPGVEGSIADGVIDFTNSQTTLISTTPLSAFIADNGVIENVLCNTLYSSLSLYDIFAIYPLPTNYTDLYIRPDGVSEYYRPGGVSIYFRP